MLHRFFPTLIKGILLSLVFLISTTSFSQENDVINPALLPADKALVKVQGNGSRILITFEDPYCGYCRKYRDSLDNVQDVTIYTFVYPMFGKKSVEQTAKIVCSDDPHKAFEDWMRFKIQPRALSDMQMQQCLKIAGELKELGESVNISGAPTTFTKTGERFSGALSTQDLNEILKSIP